MLFTGIAFVGGKSPLKHLAQQHISCQSSVFIWSIFLLISSGLWTGSAGTDAVQCLWVVAYGGSSQFPLALSSLRQQSCSTFQVTSYYLQIPDGEDRYKEHQELSQNTEEIHRRADTKAGSVKFNIYGCYIPPKCVHAGILVQRMAHSSPLFCTARTIQ